MNGLDVRKVPVMGVCGRGHTKLVDTHTHNRYFSHIKAIQSTTELTWSAGALLVCGHGAPAHKGVHCRIPLISNGTQKLQTIFQIQNYTLFFSVFQMPHQGIMTIPGHSAVSLVPLEIRGMPQWTPLWAGAPRPQMKSAPADQVRADVEWTALMWEKYRLWVWVGVSTSLVWPRPVQ